MFTKILVSCLVHLILVLSVDGVSMSLFPESMLAGSNTANPVTRLDMQCSSSGTSDIESVVLLRLSRRKFSETTFIGIASLRLGVAKLDPTVPSDIQSRSPNVTGSVDIDQKSGTLTVSINGQGLTCSDQAEFQCFFSYLDTNGNPQVSAYKNFTVITVPNDVLIDSPEYYDNNGNTVQLTNNSVLNAGTRIKYRCTANVGSLAAGEILWERSSELGSLNIFVSYTPTETTDIVPEDSRQDGCFYRRISTMYYNLTKFDEDGITFRCKARTYLEGQLYEALANQQFRTIAAPSGGPTQPTTQTASTSSSGGVPDTTFTITASTSDGNILTDFKSTWAAKSTTGETSRTGHATTIALPTATTEKPPSDKYDLGLELNLKVEMEYQQAYGDKTSEEFRCLSTNFSVALSENFRSICGFHWIEILQIQPNPVIINFTIHVLPDVDIKQFIEAITKYVVDLNHIAGVPVDKVHAQSMRGTLETLKNKDKCDIASGNVCPFGYYCKQASSSVITCIERCNSSVCENNGECYIGHQSNDVQCRCPSSDGIIFTGKRCEIKQMIITISDRNMYLIIASSVVGGIVLIFIITVCVMNRKRRSLKKKLATSSSLKLNEMNKVDDSNIDAVKSMSSANHRYQENILHRMVHDGGGRGGDSAYSSDDGYLKVHDGGRRGGNSAIGSDDGYLKVQDRGRGGGDSVYDYIH